MIDIIYEVGVNNFINVIVVKFDCFNMVINNVGIVDKFDFVGIIFRVIWDCVIGINLIGMFFVLKVVVIVMENYLFCGGVIINIGCVVGYCGVNGGFVYIVSKYGVVGIIKNIVGYYGEKGINSIVFFFGGMDDINFLDNFVVGIN